MVTVGDRPILWHVMRYYASYGHRDFILCLGYRADVIKEYFLDYEEAISNDFVLSNGGRSLQLLSNDISDWRITFADTGIYPNIGQRLAAARKYIADEEMFLASYSDCLTDASLTDLVSDFQYRGKIASFLSVRPAIPGHFVSQREAVGTSGERGVPHLPPGDLRLHRRGRGAGRAAVPATDRGRAAHRLPL
jgi:glucose-1-phosphate cytidylyltransferase